LLLDGLEWHIVHFIKVRPVFQNLSVLHKLCNNIKEMRNNSQFKKELRDVLIKGCYYSIGDYLIEEFYNIGY
jgi:uncharacterized protein YutD